MKYFEKYYPWIRFFKSNESILRDESGWTIGSQWKPGIYDVFRRLNDAGIVLLLETWTRRVTKKRENITHFVHTMIKKREKMGAVNKISLEGIQPIQTIFWLYAVLILGAICEWTIFEVKGYKVAWIWLTRMLRWIRRMWTLVKAWVLIKVKGVPKVTIRRRCNLRRSK